MTPQDESRKAWHQLAEEWLEVMEEIHGEDYLERYLAHH